MGAYVHALRYLLQIWGRLPGTWERKKSILSRLADCVRRYASDHSNVGYADITARFGTPQQIAESCLENMETAELAQELKVRQKIIKITAIAALTVVLLWAGAVGIAHAEGRANRNGYIMDEIEVKEHIIYENGE